MTADRAPFAGRALAMVAMAAVLGLSQPSRADDDTLLRRGADLAAALRSGSPRALEGILSSQYLRLISADDGIRWISKLVQSCGAIGEFVLSRRVDPRRATGFLTTAGGYAVPVIFEVEAEPPHKLRHLYLLDPCHYFRSRDDVTRTAARVGDSVGLYAAEITADGLRTWLDVNADARLSVASVMKLYLLLAVSTDVRERRRAWSDEIALDNADRSSGAGVMHRWPEGTRLSVQACAALMIGESDNTAADLMLRTVGRSRVESSLSSWGHGDPARTIPYLSTSEMWRLKYQDAGTLGQEYARLARADRLKYLEEGLAKVKLDNARMRDWSKPPFVREVGWFASAKDIAEALRHLWLLADKQPSGMPLAVLGIGARNDVPSLFDYYGGILGRDGGVRAIATIVLMDGRWHVVTCVANDPRTDLTDAQVSALVWGVLCSGEGRVAE